MKETHAGIIRVSDQVIAKIVRRTVLETSPNFSMSKGMTEGLVNLLRGDRVQHGISVETDQQEVALDLRVTVIYGCKIHEVCCELQRNVAKALEHMTDLSVKEIRVTVEGVELS